MSEIDEAKKRIEKRRKPLNDHNFKKLYNSMIRLMVMMIVVLGSLIVLKNPELEKNIFNGAHLQKVITYLSQTVMDFLPEDMQVSQDVSYTKLKGNYYQGNSNQVVALKLGKITRINKDQVKMIDEKGVEITFSSLKDIQVKEKQEVKQGDVIATYQQKFRMTFRYLGKNITYQEYLGM